MQYLKVENRAIYTPIVTYTNGCRRIELVGTMHVGTKAYYRRLRQHLSQRSREGYAILHEGGVTLPEIEHTKTMQKVAELSSATSEEFVRRLRLHDQTIELPDEPCWIDVDVPTQKLRRHMQRLKHNRLLFQHLRMFYRRPSVAARHLMRLLLAGQKAVERADKPPLADILTTMRNNHALSRLKAIDPETSVCMVWGASHLPGLAAGLKTHGMELASLTWHRVCHIPQSATK